MKFGKDFVKNILLFFFAVFVPKFIGFILVPIYTNNLSASQLGVIELLNTIVQLLIPLGSLQIQDSIMRFIMNDSYNHSSVLKVGIIIPLCGSFIISMILIICNVFGVFISDWLFTLYICLNCIFISMYNSIVYFCRGINRADSITKSAIILSILNFVFVWLFIVKLKLGVEGYLIANTIGIPSCIVFLCFDNNIFSIIDRNYHMDNFLVRQMVLFSLPMIVSAISWWVNNSIDRLFIKLFLDIKEVGIYGVASRIPIILFAIGEVLSKSFTFSAIMEVENNDNNEDFREYYHIISCVILISCSILIMINVPLSRFLFLKESYRAWVVVPPLLIAIVMNQLSLTCESILIAQKDTRIIAGSSIFGALVNIIFNILLIKKIGVYGAAIATILGFSITWIIRHVHINKYLKMNIRTIILSLFLIIIQNFLAYYGNKYLGFQIIVLLFLVLLYFPSIKKIMQLLYQSIYIE